MQKHFHNLVLGVSVLPALLVMPAVANSYTGHTGIQGALSDATGANISMNEAVVFSDNTTTDHGAGFYYKNGGTNSSVVFGSNVTFENNEVLSSATSGSGAGMFVSGGNVSLLGDINTFTSNEMNATVAEGRKVKVGGGAIANQSYEKDMDPDKGTALDAIMVIGNSNSINTFTSNTSVTNGGAIMNRAMDDDGNASLTINGKTEFTGNHADINGGAIYNYQADGKTANVNLNNGNYTFTSNTAKNGGAIYNAGDLTISDSTFKKNTATGNSGAIAQESTSSKLTLTDVNFVENSSDWGGAIVARGVVDITGGSFVNNSSNDGGGAIYLATLVNKGHKLSINGTTFINNSTAGVGSDGGGAIGSFSDLVLKNATFTGNHVDGTASNGGGAIMMGSVSTNDVSNTTFTKNTSATNGGAITTRWNQGDSSNSGSQVDGTIDITGATFTGNIAVAKGGAMYNTFYNDKANHGYVTLDNSTFGQNQADKGGAIYNEAGGNTDSHAGVMKITDGTFTGNIATTNGGAIYNAGDLMLAGVNKFEGNNAANIANDIHNLGTLNIVSGTTSIDGGITGDGALAIAEGATLNIGTAAITQSSLLLNGTLNATLLNANKFASLDVTEITESATGSLNLSLKGVGDYEVFKKDKDVVDSANIVLDYDKNLFVTDWNADGNIITVSMKPVEEIAANTGLKGETAAAVSHVAAAASGSDSVLLQDLSLKLQEKLVENTPEAKAAVEHATKAVHPETESVAQSVSTSVQNTVVNLASARMSAPSVGRNGGDVELTAGGVWAQGLFNKSKQADAFNGYTRGIAVGMDGTINKHWTIGAGYSFAHSDIDGTARNTEIDSNTVFVYGQYKPAQWYVNAIANYTMSDYSERGTILDGITVTGDYSVDSFGGALATGYDFANGITPELGLRYMHVNANDYANSYGIKTHMDDTDFLTGVLGAKYAFNVVANRHLTFIPQLNAGVKYDLLSDKNIATVAMPGLNAYTLEGNRLNRIGGEFGIGLGMQYRELNVSVNYDIDVREDYTSQTGMLKFRYNF